MISIEYHCKSVLNRWSTMSITLKEGLEGLATATVTDSRSRGQRAMSRHRRSGVWLPWPYVENVESCISARTALINPLGYLVAS